MANIHRLVDMGGRMEKWNDGKMVEA